MGQAKRRGTLEQRTQQAVERGAIKEPTKPSGALNSRAEVMFWDRVAAHASEVRARPENASRLTFDIRKQAIPELGFYRNKENPDLVAHVFNVSIMKDPDDKSNDGYFNADELDLSTVQLIGTEFLFVDVVGVGEDYSIQLMNEQCIEFMGDHDYIGAEYGNAPKKPNIRGGLF